MKKINTYELLKDAIKDFVCEGNVYCLGLSGGSDSVLLLHYLKELSIEKNFKIIALHLNHSLRNDESDGDAIFCTQLCNKINVEIISEKVDIKTFAKNNKLTIEDAARKYRYRWFAKQCAKLNAEAIFIAHHADDQAETILLRLFRGTGIKGLSGMKKVTYFNELKIIRPWLEISREKLDKYISENNIEFRYDSSNSDIHFDRNWIRKSLLPEINSHYGSNVREQLLKLSVISTESYDFIRTYAENIFNLNYKKSILGILFPIDKFISLHSAIQNEVLMLMIEKSRNENSQIQYNLILKIKDYILSEQIRCPVNLPDKLVVGKAYGHFFVGKDDNIIVKEQKIKVGDTILMESGLKISVLKVDKRGEAISSNGEMWEKVALGEPAEMIQYACIPKNAELSLSFRKPGDRYKPVNGKEAKIKDILISAGIPQRVKSIIPIIKCNEKMLWLSGWRVAERCKICENTDEREVLYIVLKIYADTTYRRNL